MFNRKKFKYTDLPPGDRIRKLLEEFVEPELTKLGFKLLKSELTFKRKIGEFTQEIHFSKNRWNFGSSVVSFWTILSVKSKFYVKWHEETYGVKPMNDFIDSWYDSHIKTWNSEFWDGDQYDLTKFDNVQLMTDLKNNIMNIGIPILNTVSDWKSGADYLFEKERWMHAAKIFDFYIISNEPKKAIETQKVIEKYFNELDSENVPKERFEEIKIRKDYLQ